MNETLDAIATTLRGVLEKHCTDAALRAADGGAWSDALWTALEDAGVPMATLPEAADGLGFGIAEAVFIARICAQHAAPVPIAETLLAGWLWGQAEKRDRGLADRIVSLHVADARAQHRAAPGEGLVLTGTLSGVPWARHAQAVVVALDDGQGTLLARVALAGRGLQQRGNLADEPRDTLTLASLAIAPQHLGRLRLPFAQVAALMALMRAAQLVGAMERAVELTIQYANERVQFGKPIGRYQAIQHQIALMAELVVSSATMLEQAAACAADPARAPLIWAAKGLASDSAGQIAAIAHQVYGAMGFTRECRLQLLTRRLWSWREECGNEGVWFTKLGALAAGQGADNLWPWITALSPSGDAPARS